MVSLDTNEISVGGQKTTLRPIEAEIAYALARAMPAAVPVERLISLVWGLDEPKDPKRNIYVRIYHLRRDIAALGLTIPAYSRAGYRILPSEKNG